MLYNKVKGLFQALPEEPFNLEILSQFTNESIEDLKPIVKKLIDNDLVKGKRVLRLKHIPKYIKDIPTLKC